MNRDNEIKRSIDNISLPEGAEDRMYDNIIRKAEAERTAKIKRFSVYRTVSVTAAGLAVIAAAGLFIAGRNNVPVSDFPEGTTAPESSVVTSTPVETEVTTSEVLDIGNPFGQDYTIDDVKEWGLDFTPPEGAEEITYTIFDGSMVDIRFMLNENRYFYTVSTESGDSSGIYEETEETRSINGDKGNLEITMSGFYRAFWNGEKYYYSFSNTDGADIDGFIEIAGILMEQAQ